MPELTNINTWKQWAKRLKTEIYALYLAGKDPRTPWYARALAALVVGYAFSPIDLIPDFIPVLGYLDDLLLLPLGAALTIKLIPPHVLAECRRRAQAEMNEDRPANYTIAVGIVIVWLLIIGVIGVNLLRVFGN